MADIENRQRKIVKYFKDGYAHFNMYIFHF